MLFRSLAHEGEEVVGDPKRVFADLATGVRPNRIEVAQTGHPPTGLTGSQISQHLLNRCFGAAVSYGYGPLSYVGDGQYDDGPSSYGYEYSASHSDGTQTDWSSCTWIESNANTDGEHDVGVVQSYEECIDIVRQQCPDATMANIDMDNADSGSLGTCWCQYGGVMNIDNDP